jgi:hypothetical protein
MARHEGWAMRLETTDILERNDGKHSQRAYRRVKAMLVGHGYRAPRLYHLILLDDLAESERTKGRFLAAIKALCRKLTALGVSYRWRGCLERDEEKGLHFHLFLLADATDRNPCAVVNTKQAGWLRTMLGRRAMRFHLSQPKADIHRKGGTVHGARLKYATLAGEKLADCLVWVSYLVKTRSKPTDHRTIYFSSRDGGGATPGR